MRIISLGIGASLLDDGYSGRGRCLVPGQRFRRACFAPPLGELGGVFKASRVRTRKVKGWVESGGWTEEEFRWWKRWGAGYLGEFYEKERSDRSGLHGTPVLAIGFSGWRAHSCVDLLYIVVEQLVVPKVDIRQGFSDVEPILKR